MKYVALFLLAFCMGFYTNALLMYEPPKPLLDVVQGITKNNSTSPEDQKGVYVRFDGRYFFPNSIKPMKGQAIYIINEHPTIRMRLVSQTPELNLPRGYAEQEQFRVVLMEETTHEVRVKDIPTAQLNIEVQPIIP